MVIQEQSHKLTATSILSQSVDKRGYRVEQLDVKVTQLLAKSFQQQEQQSTDYNPRDNFPPRTWAVLKGTFRSNLRFNLHGGLLSTLMRYVRRKTPHLLGLH